MPRQSSKTAVVQTSHATDKKDVPDRFVPYLVIVFFVVMIVVIGVAYVVGTMLFDIPLLPRGTVQTSYIPKEITNQKTESVYTTTVDNINFAYTPSSNTLTYKGTVIGRNGCAYIKDLRIERTDSGFELVIVIGYTGDVCTQALVNLTVDGETKIQLSEDEIDRFQSLFKVKEKHLYSNSSMIQ